MWIYLNDACVSIAENMDDDRYLLVRSRVEGDVERALGEHSKVAIVTYDPTRDYPYRAAVWRELVAGAIAAHVMRIDYPKFKGSVDPADEWRTRTYMDVFLATQGLLSPAHGLDYWALREGLDGG